MISSRMMVLAGSALLACAAAADAQTWGGGEIPRDGVCFYRDSEYRGPYFCVGGNEGLDSLPRGVTDNISSVRVIGRAEARVFKDSGFGGDSVNIRVRRSRSQRQ